MMHATTFQIRPLQIMDFLDRNGWARADMQSFAGDFSTRRYARLTATGKGSAILMDVDADQKTPHFIALAEILHKCHIRAPRIYASDVEAGLVLMEDFGEANMGDKIDAGADPKPPFLLAATLLAQLHKTFQMSQAALLNLPNYQAALFTEQAELFLDAYFPYCLGRETSEEERDDFSAAWQAVLSPLDHMPRSLLLRDFMPDNLMALESGELGVLDFQDAGIGPVAYDLSSLCEEVRRAGGWTLLPDVLACYHQTGQQMGLPDLPSLANLRRCCSLLSAQRHTRILGIVAQQAQQRGRTDKLALAPRVRRHLNRLLMEDYLWPVKEWMSRFPELSHD